MDTTNDIKVHDHKIMEKEDRNMDTKTDTNAHNHKILMVEDETVLEVACEIEEIMSDSSSEDEQCPVVITHAKMTIKSSNNKTANGDKRINKTSVLLDHQNIRNQRLHRRNTYRNLKIRKDKKDEYNEIIRNASNFISDIFPQASVVVNHSEDNFDNKYVSINDTSKLNRISNKNMLGNLNHGISKENLNIPVAKYNHSADNFTYGTFIKPSTKLAENKSFEKERKVNLELKSRGIRNIDRNNLEFGESKNKAYIKLDRVNKYPSIIEEDDEMEEELTGMRTMSIQKSTKGSGNDQQYRHINIDVNENNEDKYINDSFSCIHEEIVKCHLESVEEVKHLEEVSSNLHIQKEEEDLEEHVIKTTKEIESFDINHNQLEDCIFSKECYNEIHLTTEYPVDIEIDLKKNNTEDKFEIYSKNEISFIYEAIESANFHDIEVMKYIEALSFKFYTQNENLLEHEILSLQRNNPYNSNILEKYFEKENKNEMEKYKEYQLVINNTDIRCGGTINDIEKKENENQDKCSNNVSENNVTNIDETNKDPYIIDIIQRHYKEENDIIVDIEFYLFNLIFNNSINEKSEKNKCTNANLAMQSKGISEKTNKQPQNDNNKNPSDDSLTDIISLICHVTSNYKMKENITNRSAVNTNQRSNGQISMLSHAVKMINDTEDQNKMEGGKEISNCAESKQSKHTSKKQQSPSACLLLKEDLPIKLEYHNLLLNNDDVNKYMHVNNKQKETTEDYEQKKGYNEECIQSLQNNSFSRKDSPMAVESNSKENDKEKDICGHKATKINTQMSDKTGRVLIKEEIKPMILYTDVDTEYDISFNTQHYTKYEFDKRIHNDDVVQHLKQKATPKMQIKEKRTDITSNNTNNIPTIIQTETATKLEEDKYDVSQHVQNIEQYIKSLQYFQKKLNFQKNSMFEQIYPQWEDTEKQRITITKLKKHEETFKSIDKKKFETINPKANGIKTKNFEQEIGDSLLSVLFLLLVYLILYSYCNLPVPCTGQEVNILTVPGSCTLDGYMQIDSIP